MKATNEQRLQAAGWALALHTFRAVALPTELGDEDLIFWRSPDGRRVLTERQALEELDKPRKKARR